MTETSVDLTPVRPFTEYARELVSLQANTPGYERVVVYLRVHGGYDSPAITIKGDNADEVSSHLERLRELGAFSAIKDIAEEFRLAPTSEEAVTTVQAAIPGSTVVTETAPAAPSPAPQQSIPGCSKCGKPTSFRSGKGARGDWAGYFCESGERDHTQWVST